MDIQFCADRSGAKTTAVIYTRDPAVMRKIDALVNAFPTVYKLIRATGYDRTYEVPKSYINYRKPRNLSDEQRAQLVQWTSVMRGPKRSGDAGKAENG